jgi:hypothetical protein
MTTQPDVGNDDVLLAKALARAVQEVGRSLASEPRRVQGMVSDVLGADSRARRAEIDAVVMAAEEGVAEDLLANRIDLDGALTLLRRRGLDDAVATFAVEVWRYALGLLADDAEPPSLTNSLPTITSSSDTSSSDTSSDTSSSEEDIRVFEPPATTHAPFAAPAMSPPRLSGDGEAAPPTDTRSRRRLLVALVAIPAVLVIGAMSTYALLQDDGDPAGAATATTATGESATTSIAPTTTAVALSTTTAPSVVTTEPVVTAAEEPPSVVSPVETLPMGEMTRRWTVEGDELVAELSFVNNTAEDQTTRYYESIPKSIAASADAILANHPPTIVKPDLVLAWDVTVPAGQTFVVTYRTAIPPDTSEATLLAWHQEQIADAAAFAAERATPPLLVVTTPGDTVVSGTEADVTGTTNGVSLTVNDVPVTINPDGSWVARITGLQAGPNTFVSVATSAYGVTTEDRSNINVVFPTTTVQTRPGGGGTPTTRPPSGGGGGPVTTGTTTPAPAPQPAPNPSLRGTTSPTACNTYTIEASVQNATSGSWSGSFGSQSGGLTFTYTPRNSAEPYSASVTYTASGPGGSGSATIPLTVNPNPGAC